MKVKITVHKAEEGGYWAEVPALSGCFSQGETLEETENNIREAIKGYLLAVNSGFKLDRSTLNIVSFVRC